MKLNTYLRLCSKFYDLSKPNIPEDAYRFYHQYVAAAKGRIVEPMCGSGRFLLPFVEEGFQVEGFDASPQMLAELHHKAKQKNLHPLVHQDFLENFSCTPPAKLIFIPAGSFGLITDLQIVKACLQSIYTQLSEGGSFVFEVETLAALSHYSIELREQSYTWGVEIYKGYFRDQPPKDQVLSTECHYELWRDNALQAREVELLQVRYYDPEEMLKLLRAAGFGSIKLCAAFDRDKAPQSHDELVIFECKRT
jgi:trans-aconitate methyltransferase